MFPFFLLALALILTYYSFRYYNILLSLSTSISWLVLWKYNLSTPIGGMAIGSTEQTWLTYLFIILAITVMLIYFYRRNGMSRNFDPHIPNSNEPIILEERGIMSESTEAYRKRIHRAVRARRRA